MSLAMNFDHLFDLDMAMENPVNNTEESLEKETESESSSNDIELPSVIASGVCPVCLEDYRSVDEEGVCNQQVPCGHIFHEKCIQVWLSRHNSCPLCRSRVHTASASAGEVA